MRQRRTQSIPAPPTRSSAPGSSTYWSGFALPRPHFACALTALRKFASAWEQPSPTTLYVAFFPVDDRRGSLLLDVEVYRLCNLLLQILVVYLDRHLVLA